jgi:hypothetical protein
MSWHMRGPCYVWRDDVTMTMCTSWSRMGGMTAGRHWLAESLKHAHIPDSTTGRRSKRRRGAPGERGRVRSDAIG